MPLEAAGPVLLQICEALQAAHDHKIIHRDLKPDNVYLIIHKGKKNFVKVVDFGIAKLTDDSGQSTGKTQTGMVMGTPAYMSPEQAGGMTTRIDARSDIYSLGCMMFQMATGKLPFPGTHFGEVLIGHLQIPPPRPRELVPQIPEAYEAVILKCLEKKQENRYQTMREVHDAIAAVMEQLHISRELPVANAAEMAALGASTKTKSMPGGIITKTPSRPTANRAPQQPLRATPRPRRATVADFHPPPKSRTGLFVGLTAGALVIVGGGIIFVMQQQAAENRRAAEEAAHLAARRMAEEVEARRKADEAATRKAENEKVFLSVVSEPLGAMVEATWKDGVKAALTPFDISVPKNMKVHFAFTRKDYLPYSQDVIADTPQVVKAALLPEPKAAAPPRPAVSRARADESGKKAKAASSDQEGEEIPVEF